MGRLDFPDSEHRMIRRSPGVQAAVAALAEEVRAAAGALAGDPDGYEASELRVGTDRVRVDVYPVTEAAFEAEAESSPLMQLQGQQGPVL